MMAVIQNGVPGPSAPQPVEVDAALALVLAPIPLRALVERIVHNWGLKKKLVNATMEAAQVFPTLLKYNNNSKKVMFISN